MSDEIRDLFRDEASSIEAPPREYRRVVEAGRRRRRGRRLLSAAAALTAVALTAGAIVQMNGRESLPPGASRDRLAVTAEIPLRKTDDLMPSYSESIAYGFGYVWVLHAGDGTLQRIDPATNEVDRVFEPGAEHRQYPSSLNDVEAGAGRLWVTNPSAGHVLSVDPVSGAVEGRIGGLGHPLGTYAGRDHLWILSGGAGKEVLYRADPSTLEVTGSYRTGVECCISGMVETDGHLWISHSDVPGTPRNEGAAHEDLEFDLSVTLRKIDPRQLAVVETIPLAGGTYRPGDTVLGDLVAGARSLWVSRPEAGVVDRVDSRTGEVQSIDLAGIRSPGPLTWFEGDMWVWDLVRPEAAPIDPETLEVGAASELGDTDEDHPAIGAGSIWVGSAAKPGESGSVLRIGLAGSTPPPDLREAPASPATPEQTPHSGPVTEEMTEQDQAEVFAFRAMAATELMHPFSERSYNFTYEEDTTRTAEGWRIGFAASDCKPRLLDEGYAFTCRGLSGEDPRLGNALTDTYVTVARDGERWHVIDVEGNMLPEERERLVGYSLPPHEGPSRWEFPAAATWPGSDGTMIEMIALWAGPYPTETVRSVCDVHLLDADGRQIGKPLQFYEEPPDRSFEQAGWVRMVDAADGRAEDVVVECRQDRG